MLTRSQAKAAKQPIFVDDQWNDAYIHAKDEQIDAIHAQQLRDSGGGWADGSGSDDDSDDSDDDDDDADVWRSDDEANADSDDSEDDEQPEAHEQGETTEPTALAGVSSSRLAGGGFAENLFWTVLTVLVVPMFMYSTVLKRYQNVLSLYCKL